MQTKWLLLVVLGLCVSLSWVMGQATANVPVTIERTDDIMAIFVGGNQPVSLANFNIRYMKDGAEQAPIYLGDYPAFQPIEDVQTPVCFVIRTFQTQSPVPEICAAPGTEIITYSLTPGGIFWFNRALNRQEQLTIASNDTVVDVCQQEEILCEFTFPALAVQANVPTETPDLPERCVITDTMNLLASGDDDNDGLSNFEENCVLPTDAFVANRDVDADGIIDDLEFLFAQNNPAWGNPSRIDPDSDGDWLPDALERELTFATDRVDTDGDLLADFIEFFWLGTNPLLADRDDNFNGFPDVLEVYLPPSLPEFTPCRASVAVEITQIFIADREEDNDPQEIILGDEAEISYALRNRATGENMQRTWSAEGIMTGDVYPDTTPLAPLEVSCGSALEFSVAAIESDAPFGGNEELGEFVLPIDILFQRIPIAHHLDTEQRIQFTGTSEDGFFDYQIFYVLNVELLR